MHLREFLSNRWRLVLLTLLPLVLLALLPLLPARDWILQMAGWAQRWGVLGALVFIVANAMAVALLVPGSVFTIAAGLLYGVGTGSVVAHAGSMAGATLAFLCGRYLVRERVARMLRANQKFAAVDQAIGRKGWKIVALVRLSPVIPFMLQNYLYSATSIRFWPYFISSMVCTLPGTLLFVSMGAAGRYGALGVMPEGGPLQWALLGVGVAATIAGTWYVRRVAARALRQDVPDKQQTDAEAG
jgi:uncharacterized membrane protein YdjX (TVP38/TMEM64 family)